MWTKTFGAFGTMLLLAAPAFAAPGHFNARDDGAVGDGKTDDTAAFQKTLDACTANADGGIVDVPSGQYLIGSIVIGSHTALKFEQDATLIGSPDISKYPIVKTRWEGNIVDCHRALISATNAQNIAIIGPGKINGPESLGALRNPRAPTLIELQECQNVRLSDFSTNYSRMWSIHPLFCSEIAISNLTIRSTQTNGDGIDVDSCRDVHIDNCDMQTGDDCIALKSGRGMEAVRIARPTQDVLITNCKLASRFADLAIGTEMSGGVFNVRMEHCTLGRAVNGIYIKSRTDRGGYIMNVVCSDLDVSSTAFLGIDLLDKGIQDSQPVQGLQGLSVVSNLEFDNVRVNCRTLVDGKMISLDRPVDHLILSNISGTSRTGIALANVIHATFKDINVTVNSGPVYDLSNVTGEQVPTTQNAADGK